MSYTPKEIWTCDHVGEYGYFFPDAVEAEGEYGGTAIAYRRADLPLTTDQLMADPRVKALVELLTEARSDLAVYVDQEYPPDTCADYPDIARRHFRDMELCRQIDAALDKLKEPKE